MIGGVGERRLPDGRKLPHRVPMTQHNLNEIQQTPSARNHDHSQARGLSARGVRARRHLSGRRLVAVVALSSLMLPGLAGVVAAVVSAW